MISHRNFSGNANPDVGGETEFFRCNFTQRVPVDVAGKKRGVRLFPGDDTPRTFTKCNLCNCEPPPGSTVVGGLTVIKEFDVVSKVDTITIDGNVISRKHHVNLIHGRWTPNGYEDRTVPEAHEVD